MNLQSRYVVISPAKDESARIEKTIKSMLQQTLRPVRWVIVDDASADQTAQILDSYAKAAEWMTVLRISRDAKRRLGSAEIRAFEVGFQQVKDDNFDFIVKLDCDLEFDATYFERLIGRFNEDPHLGIASGVYLEHNHDKWAEVEMPAYHASGASKVVRAQCYSDIGGFPLFPGWDTADEIKAQAHGWTTCHFRDIQFCHLRKEGSAMGLLSTNALHGHVFYVTGGGPFYFALKSLRRMVNGSPLVLSGLAMVWGYLRAWVTGSPKLVNDSEAKFYRGQLKQRLDQDLRKCLGWRKVSKGEQGQT